MELTILMPCLNEEQTITACIQKAQRFLKKENIQGEVLVADNGSCDRSSLLAHAAGARLIHAPVRGYGAAILAGIQQAYGQYVIMGDADDSYDFTALAPFITHLRSGYHLVMGNRFAGNIKPGAMPFLNQYVGNPLLSFLGKYFFKTTINDFHCGLRGFHRETIQQLALTAQGMEFASEMIVKAALYQLKMTEVPIVLFKDGRNGPSHLAKWRDGYRHLRVLLRYAVQQKK